MSWFLNHYCCEECGHEWDDEWSAMCNDDCPHCGARHMEPFDSTNLTEIIRKDERGFLVLKSLDSAEGTPDYRILIDFPTAEEAEDFLNGRNL
jgi:predicted  nucleic acid-binding Zn-ribbon protein